MPSEPKAPIRGRALQALRAAAAQPQGLRRSAYPSYMPALVDLGLMEERHVRGPGRSQPAWFLTRAGREMLAEVGRDETRSE
ncbi:hypothetical protein CIW48_19565 [Methylobacterium sp. P1-11]|uniref:hypothetical protein n=1 Tax=Methylobacterium sp. P1-11 TaxID=2024616 RepID=UPI0011EBC22F|nr:hypothetical protein [Methylobacterium sp. P1-11]KAA0122198.1 hypothetical protein CIW48_19565 [Methylobacterium sp. P1-11]